eukprot:969493-Rhodomonas_salina.1
MHTTQLHLHRHSITHPPAWKRVTRTEGCAVWRTWLRGRVIGAAGYFVYNWPQHTHMAMYFLLLLHAPPPRTLPCTLPCSLIPPAHCSRASARVFSGWVFSGLIGWVFKLFLRLSVCLSVYLSVCPSSRALTSLSLSPSYLALSLSFLSRSLSLSFSLPSLSLLSLSHRSLLYPQVRGQVRGRRGLQARAPPRPVLICPYDPLLCPYDPPTTSPVLTCHILPHLSRMPLLQNLRSMPVYAAAMECQVVTVGMLA